MRIKLSLDEWSTQSPRSVLLTQGLLEGAQVTTVAVADSGLVTG